MSALALAKKEVYTHRNLDVVCAPDSYKLFAGGAAVNRAAAIDSAGAMDVINFEQSNAPMVVDPVNASADLQSEDRALEGFFFRNRIFAFCFGERSARANVHTPGQEMSE